MEHKIIVVGIGPGNPEMVLPAAQKAIEAATILVGGKRALADFARPGQETMAIGGDIPAVMSFIRGKISVSDVTVMVSGDPGYFSLLDRLRQEFDPASIQVIAGIGSIQYMFTRLALPWHEAKFVSMHGRRPADEDLAYAAGRILGIITDREWNSHTIPKLLIELGWPRDIYYAVGARLSYADERVTETTLENAAAVKLETHCVLVVRAK